MPFDIAQLQSAETAGSAPVGNPVLVSGQDGTPGVVRVLKTDANGRAEIILSDAAGNKADLDFTLALPVIDSVHRCIHLGKNYRCSNWKSVSGPGTMFDLMVTTPASGFVHLVNDFIVEEEFTLSVYEGVTTTAGGTADTPFNSNRASSNTAATIVAQAPTVTATGTKLYEMYLLSNKGQFAGGSSHDGELILKQSTKYLWRFVKAASGAHKIIYTFSWYE